MKTVKVNHVVLTLKISPAGQGEERDEIDRKINARLAEGYDEVEITPIKTNFDERQRPTDLVQLYVFKAHEKEVAAKAK
jgi:hypothetical protein